MEHAAAPFAQSAPRRVNGPHAMRASAEWLLARFPDLHMMIEEVISDGDIEVVRILSEGTNRGALDDVVLPTGKRFIAARATGSGFQAASWSSTGLRATILRPCCS